MDTEGKADLHTNTSSSPSQPMRREHDSLDDFEHLEAYAYKGDFSPTKESAINPEDELHEDLAARKFEMYPERDDIAEFSQPKQPGHDFGLDFPEVKAFKSELSPKHDPLDDFLGGGSHLTENPQHFGEPLGDNKRLHDSPSSAGKDIMDTMSFLHHESQPHFTPAAGDNFMDRPYSGSPVEKEDYSLEDEVIRHKTPSPDLLPETKPQPPAFIDPLEDIGFSTKKSAPPPPLNPDPLEDFFSKPLPREPSPDPIREPSPASFREPSPEPFREPSPAPVREPTPVRDPTPEPPPKPRAAPIPSFMESEKLPEKKEFKEPEPKPVVSKPSSPPPAPPKRVSSGDSKSCDGLGELLPFSSRFLWW